MAALFSNSDDHLLGDLLDEQDLRYLEPQETRRLIWEQVALVDARSAQEYLRNHIKGATHVPCTAGEHQVKTLLVDRNAPVIIYSNGQERAEQLARRLIRMHYRHVYVLGGGIGILNELQDA